MIEMIKNRKSKNESQKLAEEDEKISTASKSTQIKLISVLQNSAKKLEVS